MSALPQWSGNGTYLAGASGSGAAVTLPTGVALNDILLFTLYKENSAAITAPSGWALVSSDPVSVTTGNVQYVYRYWKRAVASDVTASSSQSLYSFTWTGAVWRTGFVAKFSKCITSGTPFDTGTGSPVKAATASNVNATPAVSLTTIGPDRLVVHVGSNWQAGAWTPPAGFVERLDTGDALTMSTLELPAPGPTGNVSASCAAANSSTGSMLALLPIPTTGLPTPASVLGLGTTSYFSAQISREGDAAVLFKTLAEMVAGYTESPYLESQPGPVVRFTVPIDGPVISGTNARCEMREVLSDGSNMGFDAFVGTHSIEGSFKITHLPAVTPEMVVVQLHNGTADGLSIRTQLVSGTIRLRFRIAGTSITSPQIASPYTIGTLVSYKIVITNGVVDVYWTVGGGALPGSPQITSTALVPTGSPTFYFKFGAYLQTSTADGDVATEYGEAEHTLTAVTHTVSSLIDTKLFFFAAV